ncbi:MAG: glutathione S-transferase [Nevskiaceae bacterium]|nr:MAG: glutathione S-transferase [Nevskiaceae bacterium]
MLTVHHLNNSRSQRVLWLLEELGVEYQIRHYQRDAKTMLAPPELRAVHPLGKSPVITDGDLTVAESGAIIEYLVGRYDKGRLAPAAGTPERQRYTYWMHYAEGSAMPLLVMKLIFSVIPQRTPMLVRPVASAIVANVMKSFIGPNLKTHFDYLESELRQHSWFAGDSFSAADVQMSFPVEAFAARGTDMTAYPRLAEFLKRIHARPAYQRALEKGGPYDLLS